MGPVRAHDEMPSAYRLRWAAYSFKWLAVLGIGLAAMAGVRPWSDSPPTLFLVFFLYAALGIGTVAALFATGGFLVGSLWARALEADPGRRRAWTRARKYLYACMVSVVLLGIYGAFACGLLFGQTAFPSRNGIIVRYADDPYWFVASMAFWLWGCIAGPRYAVRVWRAARAS